MAYQYTMCGLDYVYLQNGFRIRETAYGNGVSIERADSLDRTIAAIVITSHVRLRGQEVRFLRAQMQMSQTELANELGLKRITIARWEGAPNTPIQGTADRALRVIAARLLFTGARCLEVVAGLFAEITDQSRGRLLMHFLPDEQDDEPTLFPEGKRAGDKWKVAEEAA